MYRAGYESYANQGEVLSLRNVNYVPQKSIYFLGPNFAGKVDLHRQLYTSHELCHQQEIQGNEPDARLLTFPLEFLLLGIDLQRVHSCYQRLPCQFCQ